MSRSPPCIVYLDTQDYSRFGDVLRGKHGLEADAQLYEELIALQRDGRAIFPCTAPLLSELLQYDSVHRKTTICKAEAVETLAAGFCLPDPSRLMTMELAEAAHSVGMITEAPSYDAVSENWSWHPNVANGLADLKEQLEANYSKVIATSGYNRQTRRMAKAKAKKMTRADQAKSAWEAASELARRWGVSKAAVRSSLVEAIAGRVSTEEASRMMFSEIGRPSAFVSAVFENYEGEVDFPSWMSTFGKGIQATAIQFREAVANLPDELRPALATSFQQRLARTFENVGAALLKLLDRNTYEFGITDQIVRSFSDDPKLSRLVPACATMSRIMVSYVVENAALKPSGKQPDEGSDFIHALYARHCDFWRGDHRFSGLLKRAVPDLEGKIVTDRFSLPERIRQFASSN